ncbi:MAG TPA: FAD-dependent oxidoreductase, partial [Solirubrobacteraceae bacterium]|nr:FAD-dependent oxidoreductase [Solirubrobacteraceae bacterium]
MAPDALIEADLAVVGAGAAGLYSALSAAREGARVALVSATPLAESASYWAQGGLAAAIAFDDSPQRHLEDTVAAGRGAVRPSAAEVLCAEAPARILDLEHLGVRFDADRRGRLALGLEGGHSARRIAHAGGSATGRRVTRQLSALVAEDDRIEVLERRRAAGLWTADGRCAGLVCDDGRVVASRAVILATGGAAALWARTTNPTGAVGAGLVLAHHAGAALADLELMQFHPTAVVADQAVDGFLVTEAIRGEGAKLLEGGERFVDELAPRDEVARAIETRLRESGARAVELDMREVDPARFPNVVNTLRRAGFDPRRDLIPVAPAAHYLMGGIATDLHARSTLPGLYAVGECACTGLHGANRLASNSLSECFVFGRRAVLAGLDDPPAVRGAPPALDAVAAPDPRPAPETRDALWRLAG